MSTQVNFSNSVNLTTKVEYSKNEDSSPEFHYNKSTFSNFAKIVIPTLICLSRPVIQKLDETQQLNNLVNYGQENIQSLTLGSYFNAQYETSAINMTEKRQTIENTKDIEYISKTIDEIKDVLKTLPRKVDIENLELKIDAAIKQNTINNYKLIAGVVFTSIIAPLALLIIQHFLFE